MSHARRLSGLLLALAVGLSLAPPAGAQRPDRIKIGGTVAVTGRFSSDWGPGIVEFMKAWEKLVNAEGGVLVKEYNAKLPIELVLYDDESSPEKSVELYEKLAAVDKVNLFIGPGIGPDPADPTKSKNWRSDDPGDAFEKNAGLVVGGDFDTYVRADTLMQAYVAVPTGRSCRQAVLNLTNIATGISPFPLNRLNWSYNARQQQFALVIPDQLELEPRRQASLAAE